METRQSKAGSLIVQGSILAAASMIVRLIGFFYRIPLINLIGDEGNGYYSISFEIYSFLLILSSYGLPSAISKITSAKIAEGKYEEADRLFKGALRMGVAIGIATSLVLWFGSRPIAEAIGIDKAYLSIRALAPAILVFSIMAVFRGYFQGHGSMVPTALSQVVEQVFNAVFSIVMAMLLVGKGLEYGAMGGASGTGIGAFFGLLVLLAIYAKNRQNSAAANRQAESPKRRLNLLSGWKTIAVTAFPIIIGAATYQLANFTDMVMFQQAMLSHGYDQAVVAETYGILAGKYRIFIMLPISVASAMVAAAIPSLTSSHVKKEHAALLEKSSLAIRTTLVVALPAAAGLYALAMPILSLVFQMKNLETAASLMRLGAVTVVLYSFSTINIGLLQGYNRLYVPVKNAAIALAAKIIGNVVLLFIFDLNVYGAVITNILFAVIASWLNYRSVSKHTGLRMDWMRALARPGAAAAAMGAGAAGFYRLLHQAFGLADAAALASLFFAVALYGLLAVKLGVFSEKEIAAFPKGKPLVRLFKKLRLL